MSYIQPKKESHLSTTLILAVAGVGGTGILSANRIRSDRDHRNEVFTSNTKLDAVRAQNTALGNFLLDHQRPTSTLSEADRRRGIESVLRNEYILSHDPVSAEILAGTQMPPASWMNEHLKQLGELWSLTEQKPAAALVTQRSYLALDGNPRFVGANAAGVEGTEFVVGQRLEFNVHFKNTGPNNLQLGPQDRGAFVLDSASHEAQEALLSRINQEASKEKRVRAVSAKSESTSETIAPGESRFITAFGFSDDFEPILVTQDDFEKWAIGTKVIFVTATIDYKDGGVLRHFRTCLWLQAPANPNGVWHFCDILTHSD